MIYSLYSLDRYFIYTIVSCHFVKNGLIHVYILYCFMYIYVRVCDIVCQHETLINYKTYFIVIAARQKHILENIKFGN